MVNPPANVETSFLSHIISSFKFNTMATVVIVGCGIIGPVIAVMLKNKGYNPVIVEKIRQSGDAGLSLALWPNGYSSLPYY